MKKIIIIMASMMFITSFAFAQDVAEQYWAGDAAYTFYFFHGPDGAAAPDGWLLEVLLVGDNGLIDGLDPVTRQPAVDDNWCLNNNYYQDHLNGAMMVGAPGTWYATNPFGVQDFAGSPPEPVCNLGETIYFIVYNDADAAVATHYCVSQTYTTHTSGGPYNQDIPVWHDGITEWIPFGGVAPDPPVATAATTDFTLTFFANWNASTGATGYFLDVATDLGFTAFVPGYNDLNVLNVTTYSVTVGSAIDHYYRLRAYNASGTSGNSNVITVLGSTLPVELSAFTATFMDSYTLIRWVTASETDVIGFNIYRNTEDEYGTSVQINIDHIPGHGTTSYPNDYEFQDLDQLIYETTYYYWLECVNLGGSSNEYGSIEYTPEIGHGGFEDDFDNNLFMNQPNPFSSITTISYAIKGMRITEPVNISNYNTLGQLILEDVAKNGVYQFDASDLPTGVYFYRLQTESYNNIKKMMIIR